MTQDEAVKWIRESNGVSFSIVFMKRTTGELRQMACKTGVTEYLAGAEPKYDPKDKGLINVFDTEKGWYRSIPVEGIMSIRRGTAWEDVDDRSIRMRQRHKEIAQLVNALRVGIITDDQAGLCRRDHTFVEAVGRVGCDCLVCKIKEVTA